MSVLEQCLKELVEYYLRVLQLRSDHIEDILSRYPGAVAAVAKWLAEQPDLSDETLDANECDLEMP
jgi:hypothetical protein